MALHAPCMLHVNGSGNAYRRDSLDAEIPCNACSAAHLVPACADRVLRQFNIVQPIPKPPIDIEHIHSQVTTEEEETFAITIWNNRFQWLPEDCTPIEDDDFNCSPEYLEWFNNNGKPFLVAHEVSQRWHREHRCSYQLVGETSEPDQSVPQPPDNTTMDCPKDWSPWRSEREPTIHVVGSSNSRNPWEQPIYTYPTAGGTSYQHTEVNSFGGSSSSYPSHDDKVYRPHFEYP
ncbi:hypothetical protein V6N13_063562 [Hibiscus sabdariffa]